MIRTRTDQRSDPAPSRWAWRLQRLLLTPAFWFALRVLLPLGLTFGTAAWWLADSDRREAIRDAVAEARSAFETRPEFMVHAMAIDGVDVEVAADIREVIPLDFPLSSFDLDLEQIRQSIAELDPVKSVALRIRPGGILQITAEPRTPVAIWRSRMGLAMVDVTGAHVAPLTSRMERPDLPLIAGDGASDNVAVALRLYLAAAPLGGRLRGIQRIGERRWDIVLDRGQRILLPEVDAQQALERVIALEAAQDLLSRDVARIDMRIAARPTVQMNEHAADEWWNIKQQISQ